jgi:hypothetical protein
LLPDFVREALDDFSVSHQQQIVVDRQDGGDLGEEGPHVLVAVALAGRVVLSGRTPGGAVPAPDS